MNRNIASVAVFVCVLCIFKLYIKYIYIIFLGKISFQSDGRCGMGSVCKICWLKQLKFSFCSCP